MCSAVHVTAWPLIRLLLLQLDVMAKLREQKTYFNREGFQQRQGQPLNFSQFQMDEYLKGSAHR